MDKEKVEYNYDKQCWVINGYIQDCGHPKEMKCRCYGRENKGNRIVKRDGKEFTKWSLKAQ